MWKMECEDTTESLSELNDSLNLIVSGMSEADIAKGWENLKRMEERGVLQNSINLEDVRSITRGILRNCVTNIHEVPKLMAYLAKYVKKKNDSSSTDDADFLVNEYVAFVESAAKKDITLLVEMVDVLKDNPVYGGNFNGTTKACRAIIDTLGTFQMAKDLLEIAKFRACTNEIQKSLEIICEKGNGYGNADLKMVYLKTVYSMISDSKRSVEPGPGLIAILELVEPKLIKPGVEWIMSQPNSDLLLETALKVLCHWIPKWLRVQHLSMWIIEFIKGLEVAKKYGILNRVAEACLSNILQCIVLPMSQEYTTRLVTYILYKQASPTLFHKLAPSIESTFRSLKKQDTEALVHAQNLVDVTKTLIERFPGYTVNENLEKSCPLQPQMQIVMLHRDGPVWSDDYESSVCSEIPPNPLTDHGKVGLTNLGNTCYMNSVLQALVMTKQFSQEVMRYKSPFESTKDNTTLTIASSAEQAAQIMPKLQNLFALLSYSRRRSLSPTEILLASRPEYFTPRQQQDSSEFLCHLLDVLYEQEKGLLGRAIATKEDSVGTRARCKRSSDTLTPDRGVIKRWTTEEDLSEGITLERKTSQSLGDFSQADDVDEEIGRARVVEALSDCHSDSTDSGIQSVDSRGGGGSGSSGEGDCNVVEDETTVSQSILVHRVFGGESKITYQCAQCDTSSDNTDKFRDLQLCFPEEISHNQDISVQDLMNYYLTPEKLTGDNKYRCDKCTKLCDAQRIIKILQAPVHLILTLKHFHYDPETRLRTKLRHKVTYNETIKLPVSSNDGTSSSSPIAETYRLYAAVVHSGYSMDYGHYVTYARDSKENWFKFNDSFVWRTSLKDFNALEPPVTPYILFYEKINSDDNCCSNDDEEKPPLSTLSKHIRDLIEKDCRAYEDEIKHQTDKKRTQHTNPSGPLVTSVLKRHDNSDDENPPPSNCREPIDILRNRFLY